MELCGDRIELFGEWYADCGGEMGDLHSSENEWAQTVGVALSSEAYMLGALPRANVCSEDDA